MMRKLIALMLVFTFLFPSHCVACIWDYDTLAQERARFPLVQELIAGHFVRHSNAYYQWRIDDRTSKPHSDRLAGDYDDIAVAYDKLGQHEKAIETIHAKMKRWPDKYRYESEANLGTFLIHSGRFEEGLEHIKKAIKINPDAHFGREIYQQLLVEYVIQLRNNKNQQAATEEEELSPYEASGFAAYVLNHRKTGEENVEGEIKSAVKGVTGMMRFGHHDSPILLEALGDLLMHDYQKDLKMIAARAYLRASYEAEEADESQRLRKKAEDAMSLQHGWKLSTVEADLKDEIRQGEKFFAQISEDEQAWIDAGANVDAKFGDKYYAEPKLKVNGLYRGGNTPAALWHRFGNIIVTSVIGGSAILAITAIAIFVRYNRKQKKIAAK